MLKYQLSRSFPSSPRGADPPGSSGHMLFRVTFEFVDLRRGAANRYSWVPPFDELQRYDHDRWWDEVRELDDAPWYVQVLDGLTEVARIKLGDSIEIDHYAGVPSSAHVTRYESRPPSSDTTRFDNVHRLPGSLSKTSRPRDRRAADTASPAGPGTAPVRDTRRNALLVGLKPHAN